MNDITHDVGVEISENEIPADEKMVPQSQVNKLVGLAKEKGRMQGLEQAKNENLGEYKHNSSASTVDFDKVYEQVAQKLQKERQEEEARQLEMQSQAQMAQIAHNYASKMQEGAKKYSDFNEIMKDFDASQFPALAALTSTLDNTAGVMRELVSNPSKLFLFHQMSALTPEKAYKELKSLEKSITDNESASEKDKEISKKIPAPLSRVTPSASLSVGAGNTNKTVKDWQNYWANK